MSVPFDKLWVEEALLLAFEVDLPAHLRRLEIQRAWLAPDTPHPFDSAADADDFYATVTFGALGRLSVGCDAFVSDLRTDPTMISELSEVPCGSLQEPPIRAEGRWRSARVEYGLGWRDHLLVAELDPPPRCFAMLTSGLSAEWIATSSVALLRGPVSDRSQPHA